MKRTPLRRKAKAKSAGWWQTKCDDLMQDIHKFMHKNCLVCGGVNEVGHHFITKSLSSYFRYEFKNLIPLCHSCHFKNHIKDDPNIPATIIRKMGQEWYDWIEANRRNPIKTGVFYYQQIHSHFTNILALYTEKVKSL